jgi:hypothetical protein
MYNGYMTTLSSNTVFVLINGPFGIGQTTSARQVVERFPNSLLFDPEEIGVFLRRLLGPLAASSDYQDLKLWRTLAVDLAIRVSAEYGRHLVIPMNLWRKDYFDEIVAGWRASGATIHCIRLTASCETLVARILARPEEEGGHEWALSHVDSGFAAANDPALGREVSTEARPAQAVAEEIAGFVLPR